MPRPNRVVDGRAAVQPPALLRLCELIGPTAREPDPLAALLDWAARIARKVRRAFRIERDSQEEDDLVAVAHAVVCRQAERFEPNRIPSGGDASGLFRGYTYIEIKSACKREARRLRNGGTYRTRREEPGVALVVAAFSDLAGDDGTPFDTPGPREWAPTQVPEPERDPDYAEPEPLPSEVPFIYGRRLARR